MAFRYNPEYVEKVKTIHGHRWHPAEKHWSFPNDNGTLEKILEVFKGEEIQIDLALRGTVPDLRMKLSGVVESGLSQPFKHVIARSKATKQSQDNPSLAKRGVGRLVDSPEARRFSDKKLSATPFNDLKRELLSRKYSYRTVKGYLYYNRNFLTHR